MGRLNRSRLNVEIPGSPGIYQVAPLPGWDVIGTVTAAEGTSAESSGALVRNRRTGIYCMTRGGALRSLPQAKVLAALKAGAA